MENQSVEDFFQRGGWTFRLAGMFLKALTPEERYRKFVDSLDLFFQSNKPRWYVLSRSTEYLNYDPQYLNELYSDETPVAGTLPYKEIVSFIPHLARRSSPKFSIRAADELFKISKWATPI